MSRSRQVERRLAVVDVPVGEAKGYLRDHGADLVGIADVDRFTRAEAHRDPRTHLRWTRSVVVFAKRVPFASATPYPSITGIQFGDFNLEHQLNELAYRFALWLEDRGHIAMPMPAGRDAVSLEVRQGAPAPDIRLTGSFDLRYAAVLAGLGQIGANGLLISAAYGSRIRLCAVLTTAEIAPDAPLPFGDRLPDFCRACGFRCIQACPAGALTARPGHVEHYRCLAIRPECVDPEVTLNRLVKDLGGKPLIMAARMLSYTSAAPHPCATCATLCPMDRGRALAPDPYLREGWTAEDLEQVL